MGPIGDNVDSQPVMGTMGALRVGQPFYVFSSNLPGSLPLATAAPPAGVLPTAPVEGVMVEHTSTS